MRGPVGKTHVDAPTEAGRRARERPSVGQRLAGHSRQTVFLGVRDDSMTGAGLVEGDLVPVFKGAPAMLGDVVAAIWEDTLVVRHLAQDQRGRFFLRPANVAYEPVRAGREFQLFGRAVGAIRNER